MASQTKLKQPSTEKSKIESQTNSSFASATKQHNKLPLEQAIIIEKILDRSHEMHIQALTKIAPVNNFFATDVISQDRIIVWCKTRNIADDLIGKCILVAGQTIQLRPYVTQNKRVLFSHCFPQVENEFLVEQLAELGIKTLSPIHTLRAGFKDSSISHLQSLKRQVYIAPEDVNKLPTMIRANIFGSTYFVFVSTDVMRCWKCKQEGHVAKHCTNVREETTISPDTQSQILIDTPLPPQETTPPSSKSLTTEDPPHPESDPSSLLVHSSNRTPEKQKANDSPVRHPAQRHALSNTISPTTVESKNPYQILEIISDAESNTSQASSKSQSTKKKESVRRRKPESTADGLPPKAQEMEVEVKELDDPYLIPHATSPPSPSTKKDLSQPKLAEKRGSSPNSSTADDEDHGTESVSQGASGSSQPREKKKNESPPKKKIRSS